MIKTRILNRREEEIFNWISPIVLITGDYIRIKAEEYKVVKRIVCSSTHEVDIIVESIDKIKNDDNREIDLSTNLSVRACNAVVTELHHQYGGQEGNTVWKVDQFLKLRIKQFTNYRNFGPKTAKEVIELQTTLRNY